MVLVGNVLNSFIFLQIDLTKMPLGKLSRKQIESAYKILSEVQTYLKDGSGSDTKFLDASNRFFTLIPHDFGMNTPPILNDSEYIKVSHAYLCSSSHYSFLRILRRFSVPSYLMC